jgi:hypothetical protein
LLLSSVSYSAKMAILFIGVGVILAARGVGFFLSKAVVSWLHQFINGSVLHLYCNTLK